MTSDRQSKVAAIIVNWNGKELLREAVDSLSGSDYGNLEIIVVDNGSTDGSADGFDPASGKIKVLKLGRNLGFAHGNNVGIEEAARTDATYVFLLNNDATVAPDAISHLVTFLDDNPAAAAVSPFITYYRDPGLIWFGGGRVRLWCGVISHKRLRKRFDSEKYPPEPSDYLTGCAVMFRADALLQAGKFSREFGIYSEDVDLSLAIRANGGELWTIPQAVARHRISATSGGELTPFKGFHRGRSLALLIRKWGKWRHIPTLILGAVVVGIPLSLKLIFSGKSNVASAVWKGVFSGLTGSSAPEVFKLDY